MQVCRLRMRLTNVQSKLDIGFNSRSSPQELSWYLITRWSSDWIKKHVDILSLKCLYLYSAWHQYVMHELLPLWVATTKCPLRVEYLRASVKCLASVLFLQVYCFPWIGFVRCLCARFAAWLLACNLNPIIDIGAWCLFALDPMQLINNSSH